ncbi:hypothetical protein CPB85DRAFT_1432488 [Mucidula mucida]|nr:hypothetical protein CPB85DRAFT_1432488 [Mucidula mucida]
MSSNGLSPDVTRFLLTIIMPSDESAIPVDVYYNILRRIKDLTFLWTTCRVVSREFRDAVDLVFIRQYLPQTYLAVDTDSKGYKRVTAARNELGWLEFSDSEEEEEGREETEEDEDDDDDESDDDEEGDEDSDDDEEGEENDDDEEEEHDDEQASERDSEESDAGRRTKRRTEGRTTRAHRGKSLPPTVLTSPAPTSFAFTFKAPPGQ